MSRLRDYLTIRRALGYKLERAEKLLDQFVDYLEGLGVELITVEHALAWARLPAGGLSWFAFRLSAVRGFATYLHALEPTHEVPPADLLPRRSRRATPYLYSEQEIAALIGAASGLRSALRVATYQMLIGLLAVTGMRVGEAIRLDRDDFNARVGVLTVRNSKFGKSRELPLHATTTQSLRAYLRRRDRLLPTPATEALLISPAGTRLLYCNAQPHVRRPARPRRPAAPFAVVSAASA